MVVPVLSQRRLVPRRTELSPASNIRHHIAPVLTATTDAGSGCVQPASPDHPGVHRRERNLKATVAVQQSGSAAVHRHVLMRDQEVRHLQRNMDYW